MTDRDDQARDAQKLLRALGAGMQQARDDAEQAWRYLFLITVLSLFTEIIIRMRGNRFRDRHPWIRYIG